MAKEIQKIAKPKKLFRRRNMYIVQCTFIHTLRNEEDRAMLYQVRQDQFERQNCSSVDQKSFDTQ